MNNTLKITRGGLFTALGVLFIYLSTIVPTSKIYLLGIASCIVPMSIVTTSIKNGWLIYISTSVLSILLIGFKGSVIAYILFFGLYGFIKYYLEILRNMFLEIILKLLFFNLSIGIIFLMYNMFFAGLLKINIPIYAAILMFQLVFLIYDYALTLFIAYINRVLTK
jgi:hypothetical protein